MKQTKKQNISQIIGLVMKITSSEKSNILIVIVFLSFYFACEKKGMQIDLVTSVALKDQGAN